MADFGLNTHLPDRSRLKQAAKWGSSSPCSRPSIIIPVVPDGRYAKRVGPERAHMTNPFQEILHQAG